MVKAEHAMNLDKARKQEIVKQQQREEVAQRRFAPCGS